MFFKRNFENKIKKNGKTTEFFEAYCIWILESPFILKRSTERKFLSWSYEYLSSLFLLTFSNALSFVDRATRKSIF